MKIKQTSFVGDDNKKSNYKNKSRHEMNNIQNKRS